MMPLQSLSMPSQISGPVGVQVHVHELATNAVQSSITPLQSSSVRLQPPAASPVLHNGLAEQPAAPGQPTIGQVAALHTWLSVSAEHTNCPVAKQCVPG